MKLAIEENEPAAPQQAHFLRCAGGGSDRKRLSILSSSSCRYFCR